ncbi:MAG: alpha/beta fold hydrolase [bacterium]
MTQAHPKDPVVLNTIESGSSNNPPLIVLHGLFGSSTNWRSITKQLAEDFYVIAADMRNHGESPWADTMEYSEMAADVALLIKNRRLERPSVIGHSMGGKAAMAVAQLHLAELDKLVIADIAPVSYSHSHEGFVSAMRSIEFGQINSRSDVDAALSGSIEEPGIRHFLLQNLKRGENGYFWRINLEAIHTNMSALLDYHIDQSTNTSALFIAGELSNYIEPEAHQVIKGMFPNWQVQTIEKAGHWLHAEQPDRFVDIVKDFLNPSSD